MGAFAILILEVTHTMLENIPAWVQPALQGAVLLLQALVLVMQGSPKPPKL